MQDVKITLCCVTCDYCATRKIFFLEQFTLSDTPMYQLGFQYVFDFVCMWSIKFDKSIHPLVPAVYFQFSITAAGKR